MDDTFWVWVALFALGMIGIFILFITSIQIKNLQKIHQNIIGKEKEIEQKQSIILTSMSEQIYEIAKQTAQSLHDTRENCPSISKENEFETIVATIENRLLDVTNDLIEFLKIKSKKVQIDHEVFNLNNVLNEIAGTLSAGFADKNKELIFDINHDVPRFVIGDSIHLGQILTNLLEYALQNTAEGEVRLVISRFNTFHDSMELQFQIIDMSEGLEDEKLETLFTPYYDDETKQHVGLGLFVAKELTGLMKGELTAQSSIGKGNVFTITLPMEAVVENKNRKYTLPEKILTTKKVLIVDRYYNSSLALKKLFSYFRHEIKILNIKEFEEHMPNLSHFDLVVLHESMFNIRTNLYIQKIKETQQLKVIGLSSLFDTAEYQIDENVVDKRLKTPLNQEGIFEAIVDLYRIDLKQFQPLAEEEKTEQKVCSVYRGPIVETKKVTLESFADFQGFKLLIVEDNVINQKVLFNVLKKSGMSISVANNGQEAVGMIVNEKNIYDIVLMDINMPVMDGYTATQIIKSDERFYALPIVALTALVSENETNKMFESGINAYLAKPLNIGQLYTVFAMFMANENIIKSKEKPKEIIVEEVIHIDGLDINDGIKNTNNNEILYKEVLSEFLDAYGDSDELFQKLADQNRYEQIKMLCFDLKGLTKTLGANSLFRVVDEIYKLFLYNNQHLVPSYAQRYKKELNKLRIGIEQYLRRT